MLSASYGCQPGGWNALCRRHTGRLTDTYDKQTAHERAGRSIWMMHKTGGQAERQTPPSLPPSIHRSRPFVYTQHSRRWICGRVGQPADRTPRQTGEKSRMYAGRSGRREKRGSGRGETAVCCCHRSVSSRKSARWGEGEIHRRTDRQADRQAQSASEKKVRRQAGRQAGRQVRISVSYAHLPQSIDRYMYVCMYVCVVERSSNK